MDANPDPPRFLDRASAPHIATLVAASTFGPVTMNAFLPALPAIASSFGTDYAIAQLAVPLYLASTGVMQLVVGSLSDRYGRRPVLLASILAALVATIVVIYAPTIEIFLAARICQGTAIAGVVIGRAAIRDTVETSEAASRIGYVTMAMALGPMISPTIGGYLSEHAGWQATFWMVFLVGTAALLLVWADLGETNRSRGSRLRTQFQSYPQLARSRRFWGYSLTAAFSSGAFFGYLGGGPLLATEYYRLTPSQYGYYFALVAFGYLVGNFISGRYSRRIGINPMVVTGGVVTAGGLLVAVIVAYAGNLNAFGFFTAVLVVGIGNGISLPNAMAGVVSVRPHIAGAASGLGGFIQVGGGASISVLAGLVVGPETGPAPLLLLMLTSSVLSVVSALYVVVVARKIAARQE